MYRSQVRFWNKEMKSCYPTSLLGFTLETSLTCHSFLLWWSALRGRRKPKSDTVIDRYWAVCESPSCIMERCFLTSINSDVTSEPQDTPLKHLQAGSNTVFSCVLWNSITCFPVDRVRRKCHSLQKYCKSWLCPQDSFLGIDYISEALSNGQGAFY